MRTLDVKNLEDKGKRVWLNGKEVSRHAWRAYVPTRSGVTGLGWVDRYKTDAQGNIVFVEEVNGPRSYRTYGLVRFENPLELESGVET